MNPRGWSLTIGSLLLVLAIFAVPAIASRMARHLSDSEVVRVQRHLSGAEALLASANADRMSPKQRAARQVHMERLAAYRAAGKFPHNHEVQGRRSPCFVDEHGTLCAMAYLIAESGRGDIVELVARTKNYATVTELASDAVIGPVLRTWLEGAGLSVGEAQRIQPSYPFERIRSDRESISGEFASASASLGLANLVSMGLNASRAVHHRDPGWPAILGLASGAANVGLGVANADYEGERRTLGIVDIALGSASVAASAWSMLTSKRRPSLSLRIPGSDVVLWPSAGIGQRFGPIVSIGTSF